MCDAGLEPYICFYSMLIGLFEWRTRPLNKDSWRAWPRFFEVNCSAVEAEVMYKCRSGCHIVTEMLRMRRIDYLSDTYDTVIDGS